jgi:hypothetical protein
MKKLISIFLATAISLCLFTACGQTEETVTETAPETAIVTTTTGATETALTTIAETTILTITAETIATEIEIESETETQNTTEAETEASILATTTEPKTTPAVPITTAYNTGDTRSTEQKLDDIIAANPNVEIGYALYNTDTEKYLFHYNDEMEIDVSGEVPIYWLYRLLDREGAETKTAVAFGKEVYDNSYVYTLTEEGQFWFKLSDLVNYYFYDSDAGAKGALEILLPIIYRKTIKVNNESIVITEKDSVEKSSIPQYIAKWVAVNEFVNENSDESKYFNKLLKNSDRDSFFYEGTGVLTVHAGDKIGSDCYDTGIINVGGTDYIFVIYTRNAGSADIVREISRYFYDDLT